MQERLQTSGRRANTTQKDSRLASGRQAAAWGRRLLQTFGFRSAASLQYLCKPEVAEPPRVMQAEQEVMDFAQLESKLVVHDKPRQGGSGGSDEGSEVDEWTTELTGDG